MSEQNVHSPGLVIATALSLLLLLLLLLINHVSTNNSIEWRINVKLATFTNRTLITSDVKFHEIFWREIFHEIFREIFLKYFKNFTMEYGCRLYSLLQ